MFQHCAPVFITIIIIIVFGKKIDFILQITPHRPSFKGYAGRAIFRLFSLYTLHIRSARIIRTAVVSLKVDRLCFRYVFTLFTICTKYVLFIRCVLLYVCIHSYRLSCVTITYSFFINLYIYIISKYIRNDIAHFI